MTAPLPPAATWLEAVTAADALLESPPASGPVAERDAAPQQRFVLLTIAGTDYAIAEAFVTELERVPGITPVPRAAPSCSRMVSIPAPLCSISRMMKSDPPRAATGNRPLSVANFEATE